MVVKVYERPVRLLREQREERLAHGDQAAGATGDGEQTLWFALPATALAAVSGEDLEGMEGSGRRGCWIIWGGALLLVESCQLLVVEQDDQGVGVLVGDSVCYPSAERAHVRCLESGVGVIVADDLGASWLLCVRLDLDASEIMGRSLLHIRFRVREHIVRKCTHLR